MNTTHSPLPWTVEYPFGEPGCFISSSNPRTSNPLVAQLVSHSGEHEANAQFIVTAVNSHAALLGALETLCDQLDAYTRHPAFNDESHPLTVDWSHARQALALAKGVQQ